MKELKKLISQGESETLEFKKSVADWKTIVRTVAAFSNSRGGKIIIGVSDSGKLSGVKSGRNTVENLTNQILQNTDPKAHPRISAEKISGKNIIVIAVKESSDHLVLAFGRPFKRGGKSTVKMSKDEYENLILEKHKDKLRFGNQICKGAFIKDIDKEKISLINNLATDGLKPDLTFYLKIPLEIAQKRSKKREKDRIESAGTNFFENVIRGYEMISIQEPNRFKVIDAKGSIRYTHNLILNYMKNNSQ